MVLSCPLSHFMSWDDGGFVIEELMGWSLLSTSFQSRYNKRPLTFFINNVFSVYIDFLLVQSRFLGSSVFTF